MNKYLAPLTLLTLFLVSIAWAGSNHFHPTKMVKCGKICSKEQIKGAVPAATSYLNKWGKINKEWSQAKIESIGQKKFKKGTEWVVTLTNTSNEKRYIFFTLNGWVTGSNSTGN